MRILVSMIDFLCCGTSISTGVDSHREEFRTLAVRFAFQYYDAQGIQQKAEVIWDRFLHIQHRQGSDFGQRR